MNDEKQAFRACRGMALVPVILVVSGLAVLVVALMTMVLSGQRTVVRQNEDYQVSSAVESVAMLAAEKLWSQYVIEQGGAAGDIDSFRSFLTAHGVEDAGPGGLPAATDGTDMVAGIALPSGSGRARFDDVNVDAVRLVRRDVNDATQLFLTVSASTTRGEGLVNPVLNRAVQQVYTVEPADFPGFEYALLANNVNCIFCHARIDNAERWWNRQSDLAGSFPRVKVGTLESLMLRHDVDGLSAYNDYDADSFVAGTLYTRGLAMESTGAPIANWGAQSFKNHPFDADGNIEETSLGLGLAPFSVATEPLKPLENFYKDYPLPYADQVDGYLPDNFPSPFPDDGGLDPQTGLFSAAGAGNRQVDDNEFHDVALGANGSLTGIVNLSAPGDAIDTALEYQGAVLRGNQSQLQDSSGQGIHGNVVLTGWPDNPIWINGTLAIDGDLVIQGYVKGSGSLYVRGNIYVPTDLMYADGKSYLPGDTPGNPTGPRTFGIAADGTKNGLALTAGGNIVVGDYQRPSTLQPDGTYKEPGTYDIITGQPTNGGQWNFPLSEMAIFNRGEWAKTQQQLRGADGNLHPNPGYVPNYVPRYYSYGKDTIVPIYNKGAEYYDATSGTWLGGLETPTSWDPSLLTLANPRDLHDGRLYNADGSPRAVIVPVAQTDGWVAPNVYKLSVEYFEGQRPQSTPMQIDGLLYTNNAIFSIVYRNSAFAGMMVMNGSIVAADVGMLVPGKKDILGKFANHSSLSKYAIGLQLNYDVRMKKALNIKNPFQVQLKRTYWNPTANLL